MQNNLSKSLFFTLLSLNLAYGTDRASLAQTHVSLNQPALASFTDDGFRQDPEFMLGEWENKTNSKLFLLKYNPQFKSKWTPKLKKREQMSQPLPSGQKISLNIPVPSYYEEDTLIQWRYFEIRQSMKRYEPTVGLVIAYNPLNKTFKIILWQNSYNRTVPPYSSCHTQLFSKEITVEAPYNSVFKINGIIDGHNFEKSTITIEKQN